MNDRELYHYGIKGQRWGLRRYQNFDGSYTQAGLDRYNKSSEKYERLKTTYKETKKSDASRYEKSLAKAKMKEAKRQADKDYKHLKLDKMADKGKVRYKNGERITEKSKVTKLLSNAGYGLVSMAAFNAKYKVVDTSKISKKLGVNAEAAVAVAGVALKGASIVKGLIDEIPNNELRAYYSHTSNY